MSNIATILKRAKGYIDTPEKWYQGDWQSDNGQCFCTMGAIVKALDLDLCTVTAWDYTHTKRDIHDHPATKVLQDVIGIAPDFHFGEMGSVASWNDYNGRTHSEVMEAFDKAIAKASQDV